MLPVSHLVRRSVLVLPALDRSAVEAAWRQNADAIVLDLADTIPEADKPAARKVIREAVAAASRGGAEVFVRISRELAYADVSAAVTLGLTGIMLPNAERAADLDEIDAILRERERVEGIPVGQLEVFLLLGTARGVWNSRELVHATPRLSAVALDETSLYRDLGVLPADDLDALAFCRGRVIVETLAATRLPIGIGHPLGARPRELGPDELSRLAGQARNVGFKGALCPFPSWVETLNQAFTPTEDQIAYYRQVREAFAEGIARGTAAVPFPGGQMIDVPVDERAKLMIDLWERCQRRDQQKAAALARSRRLEAAAG